MNKEILSKGFLNKRVANILRDKHEQLFCPLGIVFDGLVTILSTMPSYM